jgi:hypothetical protein
VVGLAVHRHEKYVAAPGYDINLPQLATVQSRVSDLPGLTRFSNSHHGYGSHK